MVRIEKKNGYIATTLEGNENDIAMELAYGVAFFHIDEFREMEGFNPATDRQRMIDTSVSTFSQMIRMALEETYDYAFSSRNGGVTQ